jgi:hypothetical protein
LLAILVLLALLIVLLVFLITLLALVLSLLVLVLSLLVLFKSHFISCLIVSSIDFKRIDKSYYIINALCIETVCIGKLTTCTVNYLWAEHIKTRTDQLFTNIATTLTNKDYFNHLYDI